MVAVGCETVVAGNSGVVVVTGLAACVVARVAIGGIVVATEAGFAAGWTWTTGACATIEG